MVHEPDARRREKIVAHAERLDDVGETSRRRGVDLECAAAAIVHDVRGAADAVRRAPVPQRDEHVGVVGDVRAGERILHGPPCLVVERIRRPANRRDDDSPDHVPIVEQVHEVGMRRAGEIALVFLGGHRQHDDEPRPVVERDARDERVGALGQRREERERASRVGGSQLDEQFADRGFEWLAIHASQVAMSGDADDQRNQTRWWFRRCVITNPADARLEAALR